MIKIYKQYLWEKYYIDYQSFNFPGGEKHVKIDPQYTTKPLSGHDLVNILYEFDGNESIIELLLICDALRRTGYKLDKLVMPYCPFARQDRVMVSGEPLSIKVFTDLINSLNFKKVVVTDPHSEVTPALLNNCEVIHQWEPLLRFFEGKKNFYLVSVDGGSLKKIYSLAERVDCLGVIECSKHRNVKDGKIIGCHVPDVPHLIEERDELVVVDDICDGGRSFVELAKSISRKWSRANAKLILMVTHGLFTKGLEELSIYYNEIYTRNGKVK